VVNFVFNLISVAALAGDQTCYTGLAYSGGLTVTAMIFEIGIAIVCFMYAAMGQSFALIK